MWALSGRSPLGSLSFVRQITLVVAAVLAAFLCVVALSRPVYAADATWENGQIKYDDKTYEGPKVAPADSPMGIPEGSQYYEHREGSRVSVVYFPAETDLDNASGARFAEYDQSSPNNYSPRGEPRTISIDPRSEVQNGDGGEGDNEKEATSCAVNGIGYILCPIMGFIADAMDKIYEFLEGFLEVRPLSTENNSSLYRAWKYMQSFANIAFAIAFLVIVYAQITNQGVSNYNIKRMIPRLVIAAILVNTSYYLCALLVDASNIAGASLQEILMQIRTELIQGQSQNRLDSLSWGEMTAYLLSGGTIIGAGLVGLSGAGTSVVYLLVPVLVTAITAVFIAVAILAARQALITILVMISPIAFVAFVLPGTQKYFDRWRNIFQTMLLLYPIFSILFGGAQLAGYLIAQNADRAEVVLLAMFVQLAPLIITPFLIRFSGGMLGKLAGMINNPAKGVGDRAKNWASGKRDLAKAERLANHSFGSGLARRMDDSRRRDEALKKRYESRRNRRFNASALGRNLMIEQVREDDRSEAVDNLNKAAYDDMRLTDQNVRFEAVQVKLAEMERDVKKKQIENYMDELKTKAGGEMHGENDAMIAAASKQMQDQARREKVLASRAVMASDASRADYSSDIMASKVLQSQAAGVLGQRGEMLAAARAVVERRADFGKSAEAVAEMMDHVRLSGAQVQMLAMREGSVSEGGYDFDHTDDHVLEAAVGKFITEKANISQKLDLIAKSDQAEYAEVRSTIVDGVKKTMLPAAPFLGGKSLDIIGTKGTSRDGFYDMARDFVQKGKASQEALVQTDMDALRIMIDAVKADANGDISYGGVTDKMAYGVNRERLIENAKEALANPRLAGVLKDNIRPLLEELSNLNKI
jgi:hypothetical protein